MVSPRCFQKDLHFFHLNSGLNLRTWRTELLSQRWDLFCETLQDIQFKTDFTAHAFVLMDTHFHILFSTRSPKKALLAEEFHQNLTALCGISTGTLEEPLFCDPILSAAYYKNAYKYIYRNPVEAGIVSRVEDYEFSSLREILGQGPHRAQGRAPVLDQMGLVYHPRRVLEWLNSSE